jgi:pimeloyl-ACP methyl ester carboxylesterase
MTIKRSTIIKTGLLLAITCFVLYLTACAYIWKRQERFIFMPQRIITSTPADYHLPFEEIYVAVNEDPVSNENLHAWFMPAADRPGRRVLLYLHGSALNIGANIDHAQRFHNLGFSVFLLSYRGYGKSDGTSPSEESVYVDAETAWDYLVTDRKFEPSSVFIYGHSLGGAVAIQLALTHPDAGGVIVEGTFTSIAEMARLHSQYRILPLDIIIKHRFDSVNKVGRLEVPVLFIHGTSDERVPYSMTRELFERTASEKRIKLILGGGHNNTAAVGGEEYLQTVRDFFRFASNDSAINMRRGD